jgi:DNA-binding NarL/FixJ family response regulator
MPPEARVAIIEDKRDFRMIERGLLAEGGHTVVMEIATVWEAQRSIPDLWLSGVQVVILDGNLTPGQTDGSEGRQLAKQIKEVYPDGTIKVVGVTMDRDGVEGADAQVSKERMMRGTADLSQAVTELEVTPR